MHEKYIGLSVQRKILLVPLLGWIIVSLIALSNSRYIESHREDLGYPRYVYRVSLHLIFHIHSTACLFSLFTLYAVLASHISVQAGVVLLYLLCYCFCVMQGLCTIKHQARFGIGERSRRGHSDQGESLKLTNKKSEPHDKATEPAQAEAFGLSAQRRWLYVPFLNWLVIISMAWGNTERIEALASQSGTSIPHVQYSLIRLTETCVAVLGVCMLVYEHHSLPMARLMLLIGLYLCSLAMGASYIHYQKRHGIDG